MFEYLLALFMAFSCPAHTDSTGSNDGNTVITTQESGGGDTGHVPPGPPPPPPHP